jgi:DNA-binding CsgD family transcriptional regulator
MMDREAMGMGRRSVNLVAVFSVASDEYAISRQLNAGPEGIAVLQDCCARGGLVMMAVCDEQDGVLGAIRARAAHQPVAVEASPYDLTPHELRMLRLMVEGHSYKTAAVKLGVSVNTVAFHIQNIYGKLHVHSKAEAVARALNEGLLSRHAS